MYAFGALHRFSGLGVRLDTATLTSFSTLIFMQHVFFLIIIINMATPIKPGLQRYDVIERNVGPSNRKL